MKILKILDIVLLVIVLLVGGVLLFLSYQLRKRAEDRAANQAAMVKSDAELLGEHFYVPRQGPDPVNVNIYSRKMEKASPWCSIFTVGFLSLDTLILWTVNPCACPRTGTP